MGRERERKKKKEKEERGERKERRKRGEEEEERGEGERKERKEERKEEKDERRKTRERGERTERRRKEKERREKRREKREEKERRKMRKEREEKGKRRKRGEEEEERRKKKERRRKEKERNEKKKEKRKTRKRGERTERRRKKKERREKIEWWIRQAGWAMQGDPSTPGVPTLSLWTGMGPRHAANKPSPISGMQAADKTTHPSDPQENLSPQPIDRLWHGDSHQHLSNKSQLAVHLSGLLSSISTIDPLPSFQSHLLGTGLVLGRSLGSVPGSTRFGSPSAALGLEIPDFYQLVGRLVYNLRHQECCSHHVRQTGRRLAEHIHKHQLASRRQEENCLIEEYTDRLNHSFSWEIVSLLDQEGSLERTCARVPALIMQCARPAPCVHDPFAHVRATPCARPAHARASPARMCPPCMHGRYQQSAGWRGAHTHVQNGSACHFQHACHRFTITALYDFR
ncbi:Pxr1, partial [Ophiophagus hannah]